MNCFIIWLVYKAKKKNKKDANINMWTKSVCVYILLNIYSQNTKTKFYKYTTYKYYHMSQWFNCGIQILSQTIKSSYLNDAKWF